MEEKYQMRMDKEFFKKQKEQNSNIEKELRMAKKQLEKEIKLLLLGKKTNDIKTPIKNTYLFPFLIIFSFMSYKKKKKLYEIFFFYTPFFYSIIQQHN